MGPATAYRLDEDMTPQKQSAMKTQKLGIVADVELGPDITQVNQSTTCSLSPTDEEIMVYAEFIGIDPETDIDLLHIASEGLTAPLPEEWQVFQYRQEHIFYFNTRTGESSWDHPADEFYRSLVREQRLFRIEKPCVPSMCKATPENETVTDASASLRSCISQLAQAPEFKVTVAAAAGGAVVLGTSGAVAGIVVGTIAGAAVGVVPAFFTFGLSIPFCALTGGGAGLCLGTATGSSTGLLLGGAAGIGACGSWKRLCAGDGDGLLSFTNSHYVKEARGSQ